MRYLRMFTNALVAGALAACYLIVLVLLLNPSLPLDPRALWPLGRALGILHGLAGAAIAYLLLVIRQVLGGERFSPGWISVTVLAWLGAVASAAGALVFWANIRTFALVLEAQTTTALAQAVIVLGAAALLLLIIALLQRYGGRRIVWAAWLAAIATTSIGAPLALRGPAIQAPLEARALGALIDMPAAEGTTRVWVIALDAGSLELIANAAAEGRLPNFGRLLDAGAVAHLATLHPTSPEAVWAAVATGKLPQKNGIRSAAVYRLAGRPDGVPIQLLPDFCFASGLVRFGLLQEEPRASAALKTTTLWAALSSAGISVSVVNFPLTHPAPSVRGFAISDAYARLAAVGREADLASAVYPPEIVGEVSEALASNNTEAPLPSSLGGIAARHQTGARRDRLYQALDRALLATHPTRVSVVRFESTDLIAHYFLRYAMPSRFGDVTDEDRQRLGGVLEAHYGLVDEAIGRAIEALDPDDLLLVVSGFGIEPLGLGKRVLERLIGDPEISGTHEAAPDGFLMAYGGPVARARQLRRASVVDIVPTILYFLGLPIGRDMDGYARPDLFLPSFTGEHPMTFIPTYDR